MRLSKEVTTFVVVIHRINDKHKITMKKLLFLLAVAGMLVTACTPGGEFDDDNNGNPTEQPGGNGNFIDPNNPLNNLTCAPNEILYTTKYDLIIELGNTQGFGGNLVYNTYENGVGRLTFGNDVTTIPENAFKDCNSMEYIKMPNGVKSFGSNAFYDCISLKCITIPDSVTSIGENAFSGCTGELTVNCNIPSASSYNKGAFYGSNFTKVTIGNSVTSIGKEAFYKCTSLTSVTIGNSVTSIGENAFSGCTSLKRVDVSDVSAWCNIDFSSYSANPLYNGAKLYLNGSEPTDITLSDSVTKIGDYAFRNCTSLTSVTIGNGVTSIGDRAFSGCTSLTSVAIPDSVTSIGDYAFLCCSSLTSVTIPDSVTSIGEGAFGYCSSLTSVTIPDSVTSIGKDAFYGCTSLTSVTIPDSVTSIGYFAFAFCTGELIINCDIPGGGNGIYKLFDENGDKLIETSSYGPFVASRFSRVTIGNNVSHLGGFAFAENTSLKNISIGTNVKSIGCAAFFYTPSLKSIVLPESITELDYSLFLYGKIQTIYCRALTPPGIYYTTTSKYGSFPFGVTIYVPRSAYDAYMQYSSCSSGEIAQENWCQYKSNIQPYDFE